MTEPEGIIPRGYLIALLAVVYGGIFFGIYMSRSGRRLEQKKTELRERLEATSIEYSRALADFLSFQTRIAE